MYIYIHGNGSKPQCSHPSPLKAPLWVGAECDWLGRGDWLVRMELRNRTVHRPRKMRNLPSSKLTWRPCQIGVGRLVSSKNWWFSGSMFIYQRVNGKKYHSLRHVGISTPCSDKLSRSLEDKQNKNMLMHVSFCWGKIIESTTNWYIISLEKTIVFQCLSWWKTFWMLVR